MPSTVSSFLMRVVTIILTTIIIVIVTLNPKP